MSNRMLSAVVLGAFTSAIGAMPVTSASAEDMMSMSKADMMKMRKMTARRSSPARWRSATALR